ECPGKRIGFVLPPSKGAVIANLAVVLADKVPINLNFTAGTASNAAAMRIAGVRHCITARALAKRLADFPWPESTLYLDEQMPTLKGAIVLWRVVSGVAPTWLL